MVGSSEWDNRMMDSLKNFDLSSPGGQAAVWLVCESLKLIRTWDFHG
ncbi:hypothetical protein RchiOBHm_Chr1g0339181 [Rosa chinensis]|uniref:Uncharacterized protein n=1 Tax=Rosa chinensis TaxID=74649 RepID=A0A2P6SD52_ROSCH|nr:hypothetical protein RchiOBHm_Chr1g0339181 [Rosa chinensis]